MCAVKITIVAASGMALVLGTAYQSRATVILDHGTADRPVVETGGHAVRPGASPPSMGLVVIDPGWLAPWGLWPWSPVFVPSSFTRPITQRLALPHGVVLRPSPRLTAKHRN